MTPPFLVAALAALCFLGAASAQPADADSDALGLSSAPDDTKPGTPAATRLLVEAAAGTTERRYGEGSATLRRVTLDVYHASRLAPQWRVVLSNRLDHQQPTAGGGPDTLNSLREAYLGWDASDNRNTVEFGRINLRQGPGYGYNPTDFFRDGALRTITSLNPFSLRENRLGAVMLRGQRLWDGGSAALAFAPKLANAPSDDGSSLDLGATNNRHRWLFSLSHRLSERVNAQALLYKQPGRRLQMGANATALLGEATVVHGEWAYAEEPSLASLAAGRTEPMRNGHRYAAGLTYTTAAKLSLTAELQGNDFAWSKNGWEDAAGTVAERGAYLLLAEQRQDLAARQAVLLYLAQKDFAGVRNLGLSGFVRLNTSDHSRLHWAELRYQWPKVDVALQWQLASGKALSQFGLLPDRQSVQLLAAYHFN